MTQRRNMSKGERFQLLEKKVQQMEMATRVTQMYLQQMSTSSNNMKSDLGELAQRQRELQYRALAIQELAGLNLDAINARSQELQIRDFNETSDKEDKEGNFTVADVVAEDSVVTLTTKTPGLEEDKGFLRTKLHVAELALPDMKTQLLGKKVGETFTTKINNVDHEITVLAIRTAPPVAKPETKDQPNVAAVPAATEQQETRH